MRVRLKITVLFTGLVIIILGFLCVGIYYFSYAARVSSIKIRLNNRAITTARLLGQREIFDRILIQRIDSLTTIALKNKTVQAYDGENRKVYNYSDQLADTLSINPGLLNEAREKSPIFFLDAGKEVVASHYTDTNTDLVVISAAEDVDGRQYLQNLFHILIVSFFIGSCVVLVAGYFFSGRLLFPVKQITSEVNEISAQNLSRRIATSGATDEWNNLTTTLNMLLNRLQESFDMQRRFIANASHELSTPLTSIASQLEVSLQRDRDEGYYKKVMQSISDDTRRMGKLVQTLLEFAKASGNPGGLEIKPVRIDEIILRLPAEILLRNRQYSVALVFDKLPEKEDDLIIFGNEALLFTAISNIVTNGCKYSENHRAIVSLETKDGNTVIIVTDEGWGIPDQQLVNIFEPFFRINENTESGGFGLGLSLAQKIIKLHNGSIEVASRVSEGTTFIISLPSARTLRHLRP